MAATGRQSPDAEDLATCLREAAFVRLAPAATGDGVAAAGVLARALQAIDVPFQAGVVTGQATTRSTEADVVVALDRSLPDADATLGTQRSASATAFRIASLLADGDADPALAAAGVVAAGDFPTGPLAEALAATGIERRPGVAVPTDDLADGLAHSTLVHAPFSGDADSTAEVLAGISAAEGDEYRRRVASMVALRTATADGASPRAAEAVERALRPLDGGPLETIEGYADVLAATVREDPGTAVALALGHESVRDDALDAWRTHARRAHEVLAEGSLSRHAGLVVAEGDPIETVARLVGAYRSPEPLALVVGDDRIALAAPGDADASAVLESATADFDLSGRVTGDSVLATQRYPGDLEALVAAVREVDHA